MLTKKLLSPTYVDNSDLLPKIKSYANAMQYFLWLDLCSMSDSFAQLFPWGETARSILQSYYHVISKYEWISLIKLSKIICETTGNLEVATDLLVAACSRWVKKDYSNNKVICIYTSLNKNLLIIGKKNSDPNCGCKISQIHLRKEIFIGDIDFYRCAFLTEDQKFSVAMLNDIDVYV